MKKSRLLMMLMAIIMVGIMAFAFAGCGNEEDVTDETTEAVTEETEDTETAATDSLLEDPEYDINVVLMNAGLAEALDATGVEYSINQFSNITNDVSIATGDEELDGVAGSLMAYAKGDTTYEDLPDYKIIGEQDGVVYVLMLPTDVRYNAEDPQQAEDYEKLTEALKTFTIE